MRESECWGAQAIVIAVMSHRVTSLCGLQPRFRSMWERYCRGVQAIVYVVDAADHDNLDSARLELAELLGKPSLHSIPLLVLGNKNDLPGALSTTDLIDRLDLKVCPLFWLPRHPIPSLLGLFGDSRRLGRWADPLYP